MAGLSRRQFIRISASSALLLAGGVGLGLADGRAEVVRVEETRLLMGSIAHLSIMSHKPEQARQAIQAAFNSMAVLEDVFSRFRPHSQLSQLNMNGHISGTHPAMLDVMTKAIAYGHLTNGAFDITVEPVLRLYREAAQIGQLPETESVAAVQQLIDYRQIAITEGTIRLNGTGMAVTLDGIAKGYIIDVGTAVLSEHGFANIMVELGGDLHTRGRAGSRPWQVRIEQPRHDNAKDMPVIAQLSDKALATSGDYQYTFTQDRRLHHIIDPERGVSPDELASASVVAATACDADALSTSIMVMGAATGLALIREMPGAEALVITKQGSVYASENFPAALTKNAL